MSRYQAAPELKDDHRALFSDRMHRWLSDPRVRFAFEQPWDWGVHTLKLRFPVLNVLDRRHWTSRHAKFGKPLLDRYVVLGDGGYRMRVSVIGNFCYSEFNPGRVFDDAEWRPAPAAVVRLALEYVIEALLQIVETDVAPDDWEIQRIDIARDIRTPSGRVPVLPRPSRAKKSADYEAGDDASTGLRFQTHKERRKGVFGRFYDKHQEAERMQEVPRNTWRCEFSFSRSSASRAGLATVRDITDERIRQTFADYFAHCRWDRPYPSEPAYAALFAMPSLLDPLIRPAVRQIEADGGDDGGASVLRLRRAVLSDWSIPRWKIDLQKGTIVRVIRLRKHCTDPDCDEPRYGSQLLCERHYRRALRAKRRVGRETAVGKAPGSVAKIRPKRRSPPPTT